MNLLFDSALKQARGGMNSVLKKCGVDAKLQFTPEPLPNESGYDQWLNGMRAVARLPDGIPEHFRPKLWLTLADHYVKIQHINWNEVKKWAFNDQMNPDDDELSLQIVKDLHRTGWSGLDGDKERVILRRVLLAYARYNKTIGYCQGFNVIVALILEVTCYNEEQAFKVTIMLLEHVLPASYFDQTLRALSVDMAVLRDMMSHRLPRLSAHLDILQRNSESEFEPPLVNVFSMQWFLTLFATCLPKRAVHRIWDSLMLEGSEVLLRAALALWSKIGKRLTRCKTADSFYTQMGLICQELATQMTDQQCNELMVVVYNMAQFPYPGLDELRDRHMFNIQPFSSTIRLLRHQAVSILKPNSAESSDEGDGGQKTVLLSSSQSKEANTSNLIVSKSNEKTSSAADLNALEKQYKLLRQRQKQAAVIVRGVFSNGRAPQKSNFHRAENRSNTATSNGRMIHLNNFPNKEKNRQFDGEVFFNHLQLKPPSSKETLFTTCTVNGTVPLASKTVQPSGKVRRTTPSHYRRSSKTPSIASSTAAGDSYLPANFETIQSHDRLESHPSNVSSYAALPGAESDSRNGACSVKTFLDHLTLYSASPMTSSWDEHDHSMRVVRRRRRSMDERLILPTIDSSTGSGGQRNKMTPSYVAMIRRSHSCLQSLLKFRNDGHYEWPQSKLGPKYKDKKPSTVVIKSTMHRKLSLQQSIITTPKTCRNPFPVKRQSCVIERGKKFGLYNDK